MVWWGPLHLTHFTPWILHTSDVWPHFQQFLHCDTLEFILAPQIITIKLPTLNLLLIRLFAFIPLWASQMLIQTIAMSDLGDTLMTLGLEAKTILLKIWLFFKISFISSEVIQALVCSKRYRIPMILRYNFDWESLRSSIWSTSI